VPTDRPSPSDLQAGPDAVARLERAVQELASAGDLAIPPYPAVALRVQQLMARTDFGLAEVAHLVGSDAVLAADVLRCASSAIYGRGGPVTNLTQAITRVGAQQVLRLVVASSLGVHAQAPGPLAALRRAVWIEGLAGAAICQELARVRLLRQEEAFLLGLLHDFGKIVACASLESLLAGGRLDGTWRPEDLAEAVERQHVQLGMATAARWRLPALVRQVIESHHGAGAGSCEAPALLDVVRVSDEVVGLLMRQSQVSAVDLVPVKPLAGLPERDAVARVVEKVPEFVAAFERPEPPAARSPWLAAPASILEPGARPVRFDVTVSLARRVRRYAAEAVGERALAMTGHEPLPEGQLVEATLHSPPEPFRIWALARRSRPHGGAFQVELQPFALKGTERVFWRHLLGGAA